MMKEDIDVLLVDDDQDICIMMESILKFSGYSVQYCSVPEKLWQILSDKTPALLLMDMFLSGTDGRDICKKLKSNQETSSIKIMMMSAHPDGEETCLRAGADDFLAKPFDIDYFTDKVKRILKD
jgi:DNA-binding response OmpR family regulator